ncbi:MAG: AAA family ATPase [Lentisphaeria bacterium]|nr:AAA family ATPase [Lentisphaeria bacterium]
MTPEENLQQLYRQELIPAMDWHFARLLYRLSESVPAIPDHARPRLLWLAALVSHAAGRGDIGVPLAAVADADGVRDYLQLPPECEIVLPEDWGGDPGAAFPGLIGSDHRMAPLVLENRILYLAAMFRRTGIIRHFLKMRETAAGAAPVPDEPPPDWLERLPLTLDEDQTAAIRHAANARFFIISGGPGAGKTTIAALVLAKRAELAAPERVLLCAPTGKARAALSQSICGIAVSLPSPLREKLLTVAENATTIHKLLRSRPDSDRSFFHAGNPLPCDLVIADEGSMISHSLMAQLMEALPENASLILLGDSAQLNSVDPGAVFGSLCARYRHDPAHLAVLSRNHRFAGNADSGIGKLQRLLLSRSDLTEDDLNACFESGDTASLVRCDLPEPESLSALLKKNFPGGWFLPDGRPYWQADDFQTAWHAFDSFRILTAVNDGPYGSVSVNRLCRHLLGFPEHGGLRPGMALMFLKNDWQLGVANGEIGMVWPMAPDGTPAAGPVSPDTPASELRVFLPAPDGEWCGFAPGVLPEFTDAYAFSIHKSQGSGYRRVLILVPELSGNAAGLLTRELIYTAVTRAKQQAILASPAPVVSRSFARQTARFSGL